MKKVIAFIRIMRPLNLIQGGIAILVSMSLADQLPVWWKVLVAIFVVWCYTGAGNALNDYYDAEIDRINRPTRPIPAGLIRTRQALVFSGLLFGLGTLAIIPIISFQVVIITIAALFLLISYTPLFKPRPLWGNLVVSTTLGLTFLFGSAVFGDIGPGIVPGLLAFSFNFIREIVKDMQDIRGDRALGARTFPLVYGAYAARLLVIGATLLLVIGAPIPYFMGIYGIYYLLVLVLTVEIPLIYVIFSIGRDSSATNCGRLAAILKGDVFFGLLAIFVGRF
ncbi:MAG: geranylgeranylglycerol-phosphate geranylgeranyltransferase [Candidatus Marinimicrobia bacterium]|jgi:geranylgeranylglycerol-phosphate geranylgeranyltransferase|nr:geranylgeranylglycerol-phosphate geranylgeranyltransferase [Candidatus Neomarinimicrobiota bacterium]MCK9559176.1 geranylgeranylglycerol-phosphate geranylgeranyltransferase [Candidatus Neomarinimicrobiota bacterium]MDD5061936.1 geranylgeranylglycerol-phosphate geranylgeranyltransferase [Candidatus Neomarinimicrobiota bacterium]MDD5541279.1 geranylgeranylglycerol-phosphate geranylgeranyltransferase [Candidatus Neomarinimicrobiota bacterium]